MVLKFIKNVEGNLVNYENLDNLQMRIHDYFKFLNMDMTELRTGVVGT